MSLSESILGRPASDISFIDLEKLIQMGREEDQRLEYKGGRILSQPERLSREISAFLNAEGGLLIIGISQDNPDNVSFSSKILPQSFELASNDFTPERVTHLLQSHINADVRPIIRVIPIRPTDREGIAFILEVPQGEHPPYQASDGRYYRRVNCTCYPMRHYEIVEFLGRRRRPLLKPSMSVTDIRVDSAEREFNLRVLVTNLGHAVARHARLILSFPNASVISAPRLTRIDDLRGVPSVQWDGNQTVIHPDGSATRLADIRIRCGLDVQFWLIWETVAEDQLRAKGSLVIDPSCWQLPEFSIDVEPTELDQPVRVVAPTTA